MTFDSNAHTLIFDYPALAQRLMNNNDLIKKVTDVFIQDMALQISGLKTAIINEDLTTITELSHKVKGASANVSALALSALALQLEQASKTEGLTSLHEIFNQIEEHFILLKVTMSKMI